MYEEGKTHRNPDLFLMNRSHVYLLKMIAAVAFEKYKHAQHGTAFNVDDYRICLSRLEDLYNYFTSLSFKMRTALDNLVAYSHRNNSKPVLFELGKKKPTQNMPCKFSMPIKVVKINLQDGYRKYSCQ
jgi:hypothetical protein